MSIEDKTMLVIPRITVTPAMVTYTNVSTGSDPAPYNPVTSYSIGNQVTDPATALIYESRVNTNAGNTPATSPTQWLKIGSTNSMAMFDQRVSSRTTNPDTVEAEVALGVAADTAVFKNLDGVAVTVQVDDPVDGLVFDQTQSLISDSGIDDYWPYMFYPVLAVRNALFLDLPPYPDATVRVTIDNTGGTAGCGVCYIGMAFAAGNVEWGLEKGLDDYSIKNINPYGDDALLEGAYAENMNLTCWVNRNDSSALDDLLTSLRAKPAMYVGSNIFPDTALYGWPDNWRRVFRYRNRDVYTVSFKGLT